MPAPASTDALTRWAERYAGFVSPALAADLLAGAARAAGRPLLSDSQVQHGRLLGRYRRGRYLECLRWIAAAGFRPAVLKGFANAHLLYRDADARMVGDLDILVPLAEMDDLVAFLRDAGYRFLPAPTARWGFISDASLAPCMSPDGAVNIDIHIQPDCYPLHRGLPCEEVFARGQPVEADGYVLPALEHVLLLSLSNAAKDKFGPFAVRQVSDALVLLRRNGARLDWQEVLERARRGRLMKPLRVLIALLLELGVPREVIAPAARDEAGRVDGAAFEALCGAWHRLFARPEDVPAGLRLLQREWMLSAEPDVAARRAWWRMTGLLRPRSGVPPPSRAG